MLTLAYAKSAKLLSHGTIPATDGACASTVIKTNLKSYFFGVGVITWWKEYSAFWASVPSPSGKGHKRGRSRGNTGPDLEQRQDRSHQASNPPEAFGHFERLSSTNSTVPESKTTSRGRVFFPFHSPLDQSSVLLMVFMCSLRLLPPPLQHERWGIRAQSTSLEYLDKTITEPPRTRELKNKNSFLRKVNWNHDTFKMVRSF